MRPLYLLIPALVCLVLSSQAQTMLTTTPNVSPKATVSQTIGLTDVWINYHRPAVKERQIWGKLVPYDATWRAGANENTVIKFSKDVWIEGQQLASGAYGFHIIPKSSGEAILIFSKNTSSWGSYSYNEAEDALRVTVKTQPADHFYEYLTYSFTDLKESSATCTLQWEKMQFPFTIKTDVHQAVLASLRDELRTKPGWSWQGWNEAANYCLKNDINHQEALAWATRSVFMSPNTNNMMVKAKLVAQSKGKKDAEAQEVILNSLEKDLSAHTVTWREYHGAANYAMKQEAWDKATSWIDRSIDMSKNMTNMMAKAQILEKKGDAKASGKVKKEAIAKGTNAELNMYAYQLMWSGKTAEAVEIFEANADKHPDDPNVWDSLGEGYINNNQKEKAIKALKKSLSMNPPSNIKGNSLRLLRQLGVEYEDKKIQP